MKWTCVVTGRAELVDHPGDVLHLPVHHGLYIVHVEQVEPLQTAVKGRDLAPGIAQAGRHPVQLHLGESKEQSTKRKSSLCMEYKAGAHVESTHSFIILPAKLNFGTEPPTGSHAKMAGGDTKR